MQGCADSSLGQEGGPSSSGRWRDLGLLAVLLAAAVGLRAWVVCHTEVAARDSIGFIRYALAFENGKQPWHEILRNNHQHPGYPLAILAVSVPVRAFVHAPMPDQMRLNAQLVSSLAGVLLVFPMYFLGKLLFDRRVGFWATLMFQCLPVSGHILSDGLSEALFLLLSVTALLLGAQALHGSTWRRFALCGVFCGLAYLTRPEGALVLVATGASLLGLQALPAWRRGWRQLLACGASLTLAAVATGSPYFLATGCFSIKPSVSQVVGVAAAPLSRPAPRAHAPRADVRLPGGATVEGSGPPLACLPAVVLSTEGSLPARMFRGLWGLATELIGAFHYFLALFVVVGMWWNAPRVRSVPGMWPLLTLGGLYALILWRLAVVVGYLSDRHIQGIVVCGLYPGVSAVLELPGRLRGWLRGVPALDRLLVRGGPLLSLAILVGLTGAGLPKTLHTLHSRRAGYHAAGLWLAEHAKPTDTILDRHAWAHYYAGRVFTEGTFLPRPEGYRPVYYYVVPRGKDGTEPEPQSGDFVPPEKQLKDDGAVLVYHWPPHRPAEQATVVVYTRPDPLCPPEADAAAEEQGRGSRIEDRGLRIED